MSKAKAFEYWQRHNCDDIHDDIMRALAELIRNNWYEDDWYNPPHAATWLNQRRWESVELPDAIDLDALKTKPINQLTPDEKRALGWRHFKGSGWVPPVGGE